MVHLELYQSESCPFCKKVRKFCTDNGISVILHNPRTAGGEITNEKRYEQLREYGKDQVPLLVDKKKDLHLYESDDIIDYLNQNYA